MKFVCFLCWKSGFDFVFSIYLCDIFALIFFLHRCVTFSLFFSFFFAPPLCLRFCSTLIRFSIFLASDFLFFPLTTFHIPVLSGLLLLFPVFCLSFYVSERNFHLLFGHAPISRPPPLTLEGMALCLVSGFLCFLFMRCACFTWTWVGFVFIGIINCSFFPWLNRVLKDKSYELGHQSALLES